VCALVCVLGLTTRVLAEPSGAVALLGTGSQATPGYSHVPVVAAASPGVTLAGGVGYGFTEGQSAAPGSHHRVQGRVAASLAPLPWLDLAMGTNLRHDQHADDGLGSDQGTVLDSDLHAQAGTRLPGDLHLGGALGAAFMRGDSLGRSLESPRIDLLFLAAYLPPTLPFSVGLLAGYRYDRTSGVARDPSRYRSGDRLSLEVSEFDAIPVGIGGSYRLGLTEFLAELSGDILVGEGAPAFSESPLRFSAGARQQLGDKLSLRVMADTSLSARPSVGVADPLMPVEPRFAVLVGMAYHWIDWQREAAPSQPDQVHLPAPSRPEPPPPALASLEVRVTTLEGYPLSDASVEIVDGDQVLDVPHQEFENYRLDKIPARATQLRVRAARLLPQTLPIALVPGAPLVVDVQLAPAPPTGQVRGLVRSFSGAGLKAKIRIEPLGKEIQTDAAGIFQLDVPPGAYEVVVEAAGHEAQRRRVEVPEDGVVILNADLLRGSP